MLPNQRHLFDLPDSHAYLNCAYMSPQLRSVAEKGIKNMLKKNQPWNISIPDFYEPVELLKKRFAELTNISDPTRVAIIPAVSYGMATVVNNIHLKAGQKVIIADEQFPSNYYSWEKVCKKKGAQIQMVAAPDSDNRAEAWNEAIINAIDEQTAAVSMAHVHWADGSLYDLMAIRAACDRVGALLIIDGTQSVGALPFDVANIRPDALICGGYKWLLGPYSLGLAYYGPAFDDGEPIEENWINRWNSQNFAGLVNYESRYQAGAGRYSVGEQSNFFLVPQLSEAIRQLNEWGQEQIQEYCDHISRKALGELAELGCTVDQSSQRAYHLFGIRLSKKIDLAQLKLEFQKNKVFVSQRGNAIRVGPHVYNSEEEFARLVDCFRMASVKEVF